MMRPEPGPPRQMRFGGETARLARALSKLGFCSRREAWDLVKAGRVRVGGVIQGDPERAVNLKRDQIEVDGALVSRQPRVYLLLNKPRGLVTTTSDEKGRDTVFECFAKTKTLPAVCGIEKGRAMKISNAHVPRIFPVGRLDKASEGLLLFTNDTAWAARITDPESHLDKTYHVQIDCVADETLLQRLRIGVRADGDLLKVKSASILRHGQANSWLELILDEGKNRHIRRLLAAFGIHVLRLVRVAIGPLPLGSLGKGEFRYLTKEEIETLALG